MPKILDYSKSPRRRSIAIGIAYLFLVIGLLQIGFGLYTRFSPPAPGELAADRKVINYNEYVRIAFGTVLTIPCLLNVMGVLQEEKPLP